MELSPIHLCLRKTGRFDLTGWAIDSMARDEFIQNLRLAAGLISPKVQTTGTELDAGSTSARLARAALWLTPKAVEGFDPDEFNDLHEAERKELKNSVTAFRALAEAIPPQSPATDEQYRSGLDLLQRIFSIVRKLILDEWSSSVEQLISQAEEWTREKGWSSRRESKTVRERLLDSYDLSQLLIQVNGSTLLLDPVARFVPGALGVADLALVPSYHSVRIPRREDGWHLHIDPDRRGGEESQSLWNEEAFLHAVELLRQRG